MKKTHIQYNHLNLSTLIYDLDYEVNPYELEQSSIPTPNLVARNKENGHAHVFYSLDKPIYQANYRQMLSKPFRYATAIDKKLTKGLGADVGYSGLIAKNVLNNKWEVFDLHGYNYQLAELDLNIKIDRRERLESGLGRNCTIFDTVRQRAYTLIREPFLSEDMFRYELENHCRGVNNSFPAPVSESELNAIAKSIAKWVWANMSPEGFNYWADNRRKKSIEVRQAKAELKAIAVRKYAIDNPTASYRAIASHFGYDKNTIRKYLL